MKLIIYPKRVGHSSGCVPLALHRVLDLPYDTVDSWLIAMGYRKDATSGTMTHKFMNTKSWSSTFVVYDDKNHFIFHRQPQHEKLTVNQFNKLQLPGKYIIEVQGHWLCQCGYIIYDTKNSARTHIHHVWKLVN